MIVYSQKIIFFISKLKKVVKEILTNELGLRVYGERFYDDKRQVSYPLKIVIFNHKSMLGYFDPHFYELGFHESLMQASSELLYNIARHELAHYMLFNHHGPNIQSHGSLFKEFCQKLRWPEAVAKATFCFESQNEEVILEKSALFRKIQKLMALSASSNSFEAEQAMIKSQQLLLKHNIDATYFEEDQEEKIYLKRIIKQKKENAKMRSIASILETFFVNTVYCRSGDYIYLEILGTSDNIDIAEYVANFLQVELEKLWSQAQKFADLKGMIAKNSFFLGIAKGYCNKIYALKKEYSKEVKNALISLENKLLDAKSMVYEKLSKVKMKGNFCSKSSNLGEVVGRKLTINSALNSSQKTSKELTYQ